MSKNFEIIIPQEDYFSLSYEDRNRNLKILSIFVEDTEEIIRVMKDYTEKHCVDPYNVRVNIRNKKMNISKDLWIYEINKKSLNVFE